MPNNGGRRGGIFGGTVCRCRPGAYCWHSGRSRRRRFPRNPFPPNRRDGAASPHRSSPIRIARWRRRTWRPTASPLSSTRRWRWLVRRRWSRFWMGLTIPRLRRRRRKRSCHGISAWPAGSASARTRSSPQHIKPSQL